MGTGILCQNPPFFHDGTERPINRPYDDDDQRLYYSEKKAHTVKNVLLIDEYCCIRFLTATYEGKWHDKSIADGETYQLPADSILYQDMGFQGFTLDDICIQQLKKRPRGGMVTAEEKAENRRISSIRMRIEHVMRRIRRYRIVKDKLRLWREHVRDKFMETCCGLHNFRLQYRPWSYKLSNQS